MPKPANIVLTYKDGKGSEGQTIANIPTQDDITLAEMLTLAENHAYYVYYLTEAGVTRCSIIIDVDIPIMDDANADSDLEEGAEFIFKADNGFTSQIRIPAFRQSKFVTGTPEVDLANGEVADFVNHMLDDDFTTSRGEDLTSLSSAKKSFQKSRV